MYNKIPPAQLWCGQHEQTHHNCISFLQQTFCQKNNCGRCITCTQLAQQQHYRVMWLTTDRAYTLEDFDPLFETLAFTHDNDQLFFYVITHAERLNAACANRLLKSVEEPPPGYHFIFLTTHLDRVLPTIRSRCIVTTMQQMHQTRVHQLFALFTARTIDPLAFMQTIETTPPTEHESSELVDQLLAHFTKTGERAPLQRIALLQSALNRAPMPGSVKIFWRNLFLQLHTRTLHDPDDVTSGIAMSNIPDTLKHKEEESTLERM